jgi:hypothetical protein
MLLTDARAAGLEVRVEPGRLVVRGPRSLEGVAQRLLAQKADVVALLAAEDADIAWRVDAMRPQVPVRGPIPVLVACDTIPATGRCISYGDRLPNRLQFRCSLCSQAAWIVLHEVREDIGSPV